MSPLLRLIPVLLWTVISCQAQLLREWSGTPTNNVTPEDVVQDSIRQVPISTNSFVVFWTYTKDGAEKSLKFKEAHEGEKYWMVIGEYRREFGFAPKTALPPGVSSYAQWKEGWLKTRTTKILCTSETEASVIVAGLKRKGVESDLKPLLNWQSLTNQGAAGAVRLQPPK